uniref:Reverse transcriptase domain-containing protein n=1 Tax=Mola mola TaxID=94237 RepID=A0A3Q3VS97_MOLML
NTLRPVRIYHYYFPLCHGIRQESTLSLQLFDITIKPLKVQLLTLLLYADDLHLFLSDPNATIPIALNLNNKFGCVSGYKLNLSKSAFFSYKNLSTSHVIWEPTIFCVCVTSKYKDLVGKNFKTGQVKAKQDMERWSTLPLSLDGSIDSVKVAFMPRILFLFQVIPGFIPKSPFKELNRLPSVFIWDKIVPQIREEYLERHREEGGSLSWQNDLVWHPSFGFWHR